MLGLFINTLPIRIRLDGQRPGARGPHPWCAQRATRHEQASLSLAQRAAAWPPRRRCSRAC
jgi:hypothetical protein